jgi:dihydrofolate reductase|tara:strand:- start:789 stop:1307 length:519 start_codon:yes stop_codon:yes gene_type:complete
MASQKAHLCLIMARADNGTIGADNALPWHISSDLKNFKRLTTGKPVIMGRKTFDSIGKPLKGRTNIVVTRDPQWNVSGAIVCHDLKDAIETARTQAATDGVDEIMVIGGAEIYARLLNDADRIYLTEVHQRYEGDAWFTAPDKTQWKEMSRERFAPDDEGGPSYSFVVLNRR